MLIEVKYSKLTLNIGDNIIEFDISRNNKKQLTTKSSCDDNLTSNHGKRKVQNSRAPMENLKCCDRIDRKEIREQGSNRTTNFKLLVKHELKPA